MVQNPFQLYITFYNLSIATPNLMGDVKERNSIMEEIYFLLHLPYKLQQTKRHKNAAFFTEIDFSNFKELKFYR